MDVKIINMPNFEKNLSVNDYFVFAAQVKPGYH